MNWYDRLSKDQKGVFIVFTAILLPIIFLCAGLAVDLGNAYARHTKLQNAADAAILVYGHMYSADENLAKEQAVKYMNANMQGQTFTINEIIIRQKTEDEYMATLYASQSVPTTFMKLAGFASVTVNAKATCRIVPKKETKGSLLGEYAIVAAYDGPVSNETWNQDKSAIYTNCDYIHIKGKVHANGPIQITNNVKDGRRSIFVDKGSFTSSKKTDDELWSHQWNVDWDHEHESEGKGLYKNDKVLRPRDPLNPAESPKDVGLYRHYARFGYYDGTAFGEDVLAADTYQEKIDISMRKDNPKTKDIYEYVESMRQQYSPNGTQYPDFQNEEQIKKGVFINTDGQYNSPHTNWERAFTDYRAYSVVIADGDITINPGNYNSSWDKITVISLHGNIIINAPAGSSFKGLIYAPNGKITYYHSIKFEGSMVAQHIVTTASNYEITFKDLGLGSNSGGSGNTSGSLVGGIIQLYRNLDDNTKGHEEEDKQYKIIKRITF